MFLNKISSLLKLFTFLLLATCISCQNNTVEQKYQRYELSGNTQGTTYQVIYIDSTDRTKLIHKEVDSILNSIDNSLSTYNPNSKISKFNNSPYSYPQIN